MHYCTWLLYIMFYYCIINYRYDLTPICNVSVIATEAGLIPPTSIPILIKEYNKQQATTSTSPSSNTITNTNTNSATNTNANTNTNTNASNIIEGNQRARGLSLGNK